MNIASYSYDFERIIIHNHMYNVLLLGTQPTLCNLIQHVYYLEQYMIFRQAYLRNATLSTFNITSVQLRTNICTQELSSDQQYYYSQHYLHSKNSVY